PFGEHEEEIIRELGPVLIQAERFGTELMRARLDGDEDGEPAMFVLGASGRLLQANPAGAPLIARGMFGDPGGPPRPAAADATAWLRAHLDTGTVESGFRPLLDGEPSASGSGRRNMDGGRYSRPSIRLTARLGQAGGEADYLLEMRAVGRSHGVISLTG